MPCAAAMARRSPVLRGQRRLPGSPVSTWLAPSEGRGRPADVLLDLLLPVPDDLIRLHVHELQVDLVQHHGLATFLVLHGADRSGEALVGAVLLPLFLAGILRGVQDLVLALGAQVTAFECTARG